MKKLVSLVLACIFCIGTIACSGNSSQPSSSQASGQSDSGQSTPAGEVTSIQLWDPDTRDDWANTLQTIIDSFTDSTGIAVERVVVPYNDLNQKMQAAHAASVVPDVAIAFHQLHSTWGYMQVSTPVDDVADNIGRDNFPKSSLDMSTVDGKLYAIPYLTTPHVMYYRKDLYEEKGLEIPTTWDELLANVEALTDKANDQYGFIPYNGANQPYMLINLMGANGAATIDQNDNITLNTPESIEAIGFLKKLLDCAPSGVLAKTQSDARLVFIDGQGGHFMDSTSFTSLMMSENKIDQFGAFAIPINKGELGPMADFQSFAVMSKSSKQEQAKQFIEHFMSKDQYLTFAKNTVIGHMPIAKIAHTDEYFDSPRIAPFKEIFQAALSIDNGCLVGQTYGPNKYAASIAGELVWTNMVTKLGEGESPEAVAEWGQAECEKIKKDVDEG